MKSCSYFWSWAITLYSVSFCGYVWTPGANWVNPRSCWRGVEWEEGEGVCAWVFFSVCVCFLLSQTRLARFMR